MSEHITIRETIEYTIQIDGPVNDPSELSYLGYMDASNTKTILKEIIDQRHEPDYVISLDDIREVHILLADATEVFADRSHDVVMLKFRELTGYTGDLHLVGDLENKDLSWPGVPAGGLLARRP
jgi:hypothetical protein